MVTRTEAIKNFLLARTHPDLASMYSYEMECQVNVAQGKGERVEGEFKGRMWQAWTDGIQTWKPIRIPHNASGEPTYEDRKMTFDLDTHAEGIGMTGWNWVKKVSKWVGFDFDSIIGHSEKHRHKLTEEELGQVQSAISNLPWVTIRRSTGGRGLHLYVQVPDVPTNTHTEHAALARAILGRMSALAGFDFQSKVDAVGGNLWVWHRKMIGTDGLTMIKQGEVLKDVPTNWPEHVPVIRGSRRKVMPTFALDGDKDVESMFEELTSKKSNVPLDTGHENLIQYLEKNKCLWNWDQDSKMLTTYTWDLKKAHTELKMRGTFETMASGRDHGVSFNCFCFPMPNGGWVVRRFTRGVQEVAGWEQDNQGYTKTFLNVDPDLKIASKAFDGVEDEKGGFNFNSSGVAEKAANLLGVKLGLPEDMAGRATRLSTHTDGRLLVHIDKSDRDDGGKMRGWMPTKNKKQWMRIFDVRINAAVENETVNYDDLIRHLVTQTDGKDYQTGWALKGDGYWRIKQKDDLKTYLKGVYDRNPKEVDQILGSCIAKPWTILCKPFEPEFLGDRTWNRNAAQLAYTPSKDTTNLQYPTWTRILNHVGRGLDDAISRDSWCKNAGISKGADYLKCWIASLFQQPTQPLPYLFLYSRQQATGKSTLHEALTLLMTRGMMKAANAITSNGNFNGELEGNVLCVVEEVDLRTNRTAQDKVKDWVTSPTLQIHHKNATPYQVVNTTHWIQTANNPDFCPGISSEDKRITMIEVQPLDFMDMMPRRELHELLKKEAPDFLAEVLSLELPQSPDRLNIPIVKTEIKDITSQKNQSAIERFIDEECHYVEGEMIKWGEFYERFKSWLDPADIEYWGKIRTGKKLPTKFPKGRRHEDNGQWYIGNISYLPPPPGDQIRKPCRLEGDRLVT